MVTFWLVSQFWREEVSGLAQDDRCPSSKCFATSTAHRNTPPNSTHRTSELKVGSRLLPLKPKVNQQLTMTILSTVITSVMCLCSTFQIQLYWQKGYTWQERDYEFTTFCWTRNYAGLKSWGVCWYGGNFGICWPDAVYISKCGLEDTRQMWTFRDLRGGEFQIKSPTQPTCLEAVGGNDLRMRLCDSSNKNQRFTGSTGARKFSLKKSGRCIGQKHHPKNGEVSVETRSS
jgi:Ricin-type beta-trefoil lectin domain